MMTTAQYAVRAELRIATRQYQQARHGLAVANTMHDSYWRSRAFAYLNQSRARLRRAIVAMEKALGRRR